MSNEELIQVIKDGVSRAMSEAKAKTEVSEAKMEEAYRLAAEEHKKAVEQEQREKFEKDVLGVNDKIKEIKDRINHKYQDELAALKSQSKGSIVARINLNMLENKIRSEIDLQINQHNNRWVVIQEPKGGMTTEQIVDVIKDGTTQMKKEREERIAYDRQKAIDRNLGVDTPPRF